MRKQLALAAALAAMPFATAVAGPLDYTYVEGGYTNLQQDLPQYMYSNTLGARPDDLEANGFFIGGSVEVSETFYLFADYRRGEDTVDVELFYYFEDGIAAEVSQVDVTATRFSGGLGYRHGVGENTDLLAEFGAAYSGVEIEDLEEYEIDDTALRASVGIRSAPTESFELWAKGHYTDNDLIDSEFSGSVGVQYRFAPTLGIVGAYEGGSGYSQYSVGLRATF
jgi:hypothetical protein